MSGIGILIAELERKPVVGAGCWGAGLSGCISLSSGPDSCLGLVTSHSPGGGTSFFMPSLNNSFLEIN